MFASRAALPKSTRLRRAVVPTLAVAALTLAGCGSTDGAEAQSAQNAQSAQPTSAAVTELVSTTALSPQVDHLHGLHILADGSVVAGTHSGLVSIGADGATARIGALDDDLMGLTGIAGTDTILSSGHPGKSSTSPNPLGLVASADRGQSWTAKSLVGEIDFHALAGTDKLIVGFGGGETLMVSTDGGSTWTDGAAEPAGALAITGDDVWAVTATGLQRSSDAARTFTPVADAPNFVVIAAGVDGSLWGVDLNGIAWRSGGASPVGERWEQRGMVGPVDALAAVDYNSAVAATTRSVFRLS